MSATNVQTPARAVRRTLALAIGALALACGGAQAAPGWHGGGGGGWHGGGGGWHGGGWHGGVVYHGWGWDPLWDVGLGVALAAPLYYDQPNYVVVNPPTYYPQPVYTVPAAPAAPTPVQAPAAAPEPIFYPRNGQNAAQVEADRQACNRWATTQHNAMNDASIFQRATLACMDGRGYTAR